MRLALVLNGGVSLAVWMGGVTAEIDRMRRAAYPALMHGGGDPVLKRWEHLLERLRVRLIVDVIAGASAGGLNGRCWRPRSPAASRFRSCGTCGSRSADIESASAQDQRPGVDRLSILDGDLLTASIAKVFADLKPLAKAARRRRRCGIA